MGISLHRPTLIVFKLVFIRSHCDLLNKYRFNWRERVEKVDTFCRAGEEKASGHFYLLVRIIWRPILIRQFSLDPACFG